MSSKMIEFYDKDLPEIPNKKYFMIGEVADICNLKTHVLRYWEQEFSQLTPTTRRGNRRYYQKHDVQLIRKIRHLLYEEGFTISGAIQQLNGEKESKKTTTESSKVDSAANAKKLDTMMELKEIREGLEDLLKIIKS